MLDMNLLGTMAMAVGLVGAAALALWQLPWSESELRSANDDLKASVSRAAHSAQGHRRTLRIAVR